MTAANLAVIFGPNLLQRERGADASSHIYAMGIEDSTAIISVTLVLIQNYKRLFTVERTLLQLLLQSGLCDRWLQPSPAFPSRFLPSSNRKS